MSAIFAHQLPIACKYSILARVYFDVSNTKFGYAKQIVFLYKKQRFIPKNTSFTPKFNAKSIKTHCVLLLNALRFGAKCSAFWC